MSLIKSVAETALLVTGKPPYSRKEFIAMKQYSPLFQTLHDESEPVGKLGRGTHYSVLRAVAWRDEQSRSLPRPHDLDIALIWDEDHDERVVPVLESLYIEGLLWPVAFVGERKAMFTVVLSSAAVNALSDEELEAYSQRVEAVVHSFEDDVWSVNVNGIDGTHFDICGDSFERVNLYLKSINMLWSLGIKPIE